MLSGPSGRMVNVEGSIWIGISPINCRISSGPISSEIKIEQAMTPGLGLSPMARARWAVINKYGRDILASAKSRRLSLLTCSAGFTIPAYPACDMNNTGVPRLRSAIARWAFFCMVNKGVMSVYPRCSYWSDLWDQSND